MPNENEAPTKNSVPADGINIQRLRDPLEIVTEDITYKLKPTDEEYQWQMIGGRYHNEIVAVLGSCANNNPAQLVKDRLIAGYSLLFMRETGAKVVSSPIKSFRVELPVS